MRTIMMIACSLVVGCASDATFRISYKQSIKEFESEVSLDASPKGVEKISWNISPSPIANGSTVR